jgi:hypothetical protein
LQIAPLSFSLSRAYSAQVADLWKSYCRKIETDPVKAKAITSFLGFMIGDSIAQKVEGHTFNPIRSVPASMMLVPLPPKTTAGSPRI